MTNWKKFKIESRHDAKSFDFILFSLDKNVEYSDKGYANNHVFCADTSPFNSWKEEDYIEIDLDEVQYYSSEHQFNDTSIVRKYGSSAVVPSSSSNQQITSNQIQERDERMRRWVEESGGKYEVDFIARQEYRDDGRISAHELKWTYRKK